jgi:hypothetical protein
MVQVSVQYNEFFPFKLLFENLGLHKDSNLQNGNPLGIVWVQSFTLSHTFESVNVILMLHFWSTPFHALILVARLEF